MYTKPLIPLDGSKTAEQVLPYARFFTKRFSKPVELIAVNDIGEMMAYVCAERAAAVYDMIQKGESSTGITSGLIQCEVLVPLNGSSRKEATNAQVKTD